MENLNLVSLPHFVSVENLSVEQVEALINRAEYFKNGGATPNLTDPIYITNMLTATCSLAAVGIFLPTKSALIGNSR